MQCMMMLLLLILLFCGKGLLCIDRLTKPQIQRILCTHSTRMGLDVRGVGIFYLNFSPYSRNYSSLLQSCFWQCTIFLMQQWFNLCKLLMQRTVQGKDMKRLVHLYRQIMFRTIKWILKTYHYVLLEHKFNFSDI